MSENRPPAPPSEPNNLVAAQLAWKKPQLLGMQQAARELSAIGPDNPSMPEPYFRDFLTELYDAKTGAFNTSLWFHVVGEWRKGLDVMGSDGKVLFTTPPVVSTIKTRAGERRTDENGHRTPNIAQVADYAALQGRRHPMLEARTMNEGLAAYRPEVYGGLEEAWAEILAKYGLVKSTTAGKVQHSVDDLLKEEGELL
jgi:hypothetical protein